jgi:hypothetical protein
MRLQGKRQAFRLSAIAVTILLALIGSYRAVRYVNRSLDGGRAKYTVPIISSKDEAVVRNEVSRVNELFHVVVRAEVLKPKWDLGNRVETLYGQWEAKIWIASDPAIVFSKLSKELSPSVDERIGSYLADETVLGGPRFDVTETPDGGTLVIISGPLRKRKSG